MTFSLFFILMLYFGLILWLGHGIDRLLPPLTDEEMPVHQFSILVPFRNEVANLPLLLESMTKLEYPEDKFELILIDDASTDRSVEIVEQFKMKYPGYPLQLLTNSIKSKAPKKDAIVRGMRFAKNQWIITTDADCKVPPRWLHGFDDMIRQCEVNMIVAPVSYFDRKGLLNKFQILDMLSLQGVTMGSFGNRGDGLGQPFLCNGANLCYTKESFNAVRGFEGNDHIASGDDVFLLQKMMEQFPDKVQFLKSEGAIVQTSSKASWKALFEQRIRWASKTRAYKPLFPKLVGLLTFVINLMMIFAVIWVSTGQSYWKEAGLLLLLKFIADFVLLYKTACFFDQRIVLKYYVVSGLIYPLFNVYVAMLSLFKGYGWKGRSYSKTI